MPKPRRRRTRSRRTTRRLHRTRRHRQRGGDNHIDLDEWLTRVGDKIKALPQTVTGLDYSILETMKDDTLTLTRDTTPYVMLEPGQSEGFLSEDKSTAGKPLLGIAANIVGKLGAKIFTSPKVFKETITQLKSGPDSKDFSLILQFMRNVEASLRKTQQTIDLTDETIYPLYIWYAVANYDKAETDNELFPMLISEEEPPEATEAPANPEAPKANPGGATESTVPTPEPAQPAR